MQVLYDDQFLIKKKLYFTPNVKKLFKSAILFSNDHSVILAVVNLNYFK